MKKVILLFILGLCSCQPATTSSRPLIFPTDPKVVMAAFLLGIRNFISETMSFAVMMRDLREKNLVEQTYLPIEHMVLLLNKSYAIIPESPRGNQVCEQWRSCAFKLITYFEDSQSAIEDIRGDTTLKNEEKNALVIRKFKEMSSKLIIEVKELDSAVRENREAKLNLK